MTSPLLEPILTILRTTPEGISEHKLISHLESNADITFKSRKGDNLALFQAHFIVMNALYQLRDLLFQDNSRLTISPLCIKIEPLQEQMEDDLPSLETDAHLSSYYLNLDNLEDTSGKDVEKLLSGFWSRFYSIKKQADALDCLGLATGTAWPKVLQRYRQLVAHHHPDKGGDMTRFIAIRGAYETLKQCRELRDNAKPNR